MRLPIFPIFLNLADNSLVKYYYYHQHMNNFPYNMSPFNSTQQSDFRNSMDFMSSQRFRNTVGFDYNPTPIFRQSISNNLRFRNSLDIETARDIIEQLSVNRRPDNSSYGKLHNTLSQLQVKLKKAKKQLSSRGNVLQDLNDDQKSEEQNSFGQMVESRIKPKHEAGITSILSPRVGKGGFFTQSAKTFPSMTASQPYVTKIKTYYLEEIAKAMSGESKEAYEHLSISLKVIRSIQNFQPLSFMEIEDKKVNLPKAKDDKRKTLVIDIDETIIHCQEEDTQTHDLVLPIKLQNGEYANAYIAIRPYAISFLKKMSKTFEIIAFTASHQSYADVVLDEIDPNREYIKYRLYRDHCFQIHPNIYTKDLRVINRDLSQMVLIDNAPYSYIFQLQNGIPIIPFYKGEDYQLPKLQKYLEEIAKCKDVRQLNKQTFKLHQYQNYSTPEQLAKTLYFKK